MAMSIASKLKKENINSHAYLLIANDQAEIDGAIAYLIEQTGALRDDIIRAQTESDQDKSGEIKVDIIRDFIHNLSLTPYGSTRIGVIERSENLNLSSANILLKILEEPPQKTLIILTARSENILATIKSRCRIYKSSSGPIPRQSFGQAFSYESVLTANLAEAFKIIETVTKAGETDRFLAEFLTLTRAKMIEGISLVEEDLAEKIIETQSRIKHNVNPRLALENLIMKARRG